MVFRRWIRCGADLGIKVLLISAAKKAVACFGRRLRWGVEVCTASSFAAKGEFAVRTDRIKFGERVYFRHFTTGRYLTSIAGALYDGPSSSGQQMAYGAMVPDENSVWIIGVAGGDFAAQAGNVVKAGHAIRVLHEETNGYLHSHINRSPVSLQSGDSQREVTVYFNNDENDHWTVANISENTEKWKFRHFDGDFFLHSHNRTAVFTKHWRSDCYEVTACKDKNDDDCWILMPAEPKPVPVVS
jgi:dolichyl-phosphate-mannose--protein O-mannosyl transferase